jgi:hypothetical protein
MSTLVHMLKYRFDADYREKVDSKIRFRKIMAVNNSIMQCRK